MRIERDAGAITLRDRPGPFWALGLFLLAGGVITALAPLGLATNATSLEPWQRVAAFAVGLGVSAGALWWLARSPATRVKADLVRRRLHVVRLGLTGRREWQFSFDELARVEVEQGTDDDGGVVWRPALRLMSGDRILLSELWSHDRVTVDDGLQALASACGLPSPTIAGAIPPGAAG